MQPANNAVARKLDADAAAVRVPAQNLEIFLYREFATDAECEHLVSLVMAGCKPSRLFAQHPDAEFRTSETCNLDRSDAVVQALEARIAALLGIDPAHGEYLQGQKYGVGQQYKPHHDFLREDQPYWQRQKDVGGQRTWTAMIYLNSPDEGGETYFPAVDLTLLPRRGTLVAWNNLGVDGAPNPATLHQALPLVQGEKFIVTKWFRQDTWGPPASDRRNRTSANT